MRAREVRRQPVPAPLRREAEGAVDGQPPAAATTFCALDLDEVKVEVAFGVVLGEDRITSLRGELTGGLVQEPDEFDTIWSTDGMRQPQLLGI